MTWRINISYGPGMRLVVGDVQEKGIRLKLTDPWGNEQNTVSGTKQEYGVGGFEFGANEPGVYSLELENEQYEIPTVDGITRLLLTRVNGGNGWIPDEVSGRKVTSRGVHSAPFGQNGSWAPDILTWCRRWVERNLSWILLPCDGDDSLVERECWRGTELEGKSTCEVLLDHGIIPIYRVNDLKMPQQYNHWEHVHQGVNLYDKYHLPFILKLWNEPRLDNEWIGGKAPPNWKDVYFELFNPAAARTVYEGGVAVFADAPNWGEDPFPYMADIFKLWERDEIVDGLHNYGHNKPPEFPDVPAVTEKKPLEQWRYDWMLGPMKSDPDWNQWSLAEINHERKYTDGPHVPDDTCYRDWENHAAWMEKHFGKTLLMGMAEGGWGPGDRLDPRWPRCGIEQVFWYTNEMFNDDSPLIFKCPWLVASAAMGGIGWEDKAWWGGEFVKDYGFEKPAAKGLRCGG